MANPVSIFDAPKPDRENDGENPHRRGNEPMRVLKKNPADPFRNGKQKHVVAERGWPIGHGEANAFTRDHSAAADEEQRHDGREPGEAIKPSAVAAVCDRRTIRIRSTHGRKDNPMKTKCGGHRPPLQKGTVTHPDSAKLPDCFAAEYLDFPSLVQPVAVLFPEVDWRVRLVEAQPECQPVRHAP